MSEPVWPYRRAIIAGMSFVASRGTFRLTSANSSSHQALADRALIVKSTL